MVKTFRAYTPSRRFATVEDFSEITKKKPESFKQKIRELKNTSKDNLFLDDLRDIFYLSDL